MSDLKDATFSGSDFHQFTPLFDRGSEGFLDQDINTSSKKISCNRTVKLSWDSNTHAINLSKEISIIGERRCLTLDRNLSRSGCINVYNSN
jgi:hypothetical protein